MFTIKEAAERLGITTYTLRYYEKINLLPEVNRRETNQARVYTEEDLRFIQFLLSLKETGMSLSDMADFVQDGCLAGKVERTSDEFTASVQRRLDVLQKHFIELEAQKARISQIIELTREKINHYKTFL